MPENNIQKDYYGHDANHRALIDLSNCQPWWKLGDYELGFGPNSRPLDCKVNQGRGYVGTREAPQIASSWQGFKPAADERNLG